MKRTVVVMPGDGIGRVVVPQALRVLDAVGFDADYVQAEVGWDAWRATGVALPERTVALLREHGLGLFGAITSKPAEEAQRALAVELQGRGVHYESPALAMRRRLGLHTAIRPCRSWQGNPTNFVRRTAEGLEEPPVDVTVIMQNTECMYAGVEWSGLPQDLRSAMDRHKAMGQFEGVASSELSLSCRVLSSAGCRAIARDAFAYAQRRGKRTVTVCDKWGVMQETASMLLQAAEQEGERWPGIGLNRVNIDALVPGLMRHPGAYEVLLCSAMVGDIASDAAAALVGGLGFTPCANLGDGCAVFEPTHGSAPARQQEDPPRVNPIATILAAAMLCEHVGETAQAQAIRRAVGRVVARGEVRTADMLGGRATGATTGEMTDAVLGELRGTA